MPGRVEGRFRRRREHPSLARPSPRTAWPRCAHRHESCDWRCPRFGLGTRPGERAGRKAASRVLAQGHRAPPGCLQFRVGPPGRFQRTLRPASGRPASTSARPRHCSARPTSSRGPTPRQRGSGSAAFAKTARQDRKRRRIRRGPAAEASAWLRGSQGRAGSGDRPWIQQWRASWLRCRGTGGCRAHPRAVCPTGSPAEGSRRPSPVRVAPAR